MRQISNRLFFLILVCVILPNLISGQTPFSLERVTIYYDAAESAANNGPLSRTLELKWLSDPALPGDYKVHIHKYIDDNMLYQVVDSVRLDESQNNNWGDPVANYHNRQEIYRVTLYDNAYNVLYLSDFHGTILLENILPAYIDHCSGTILLSWDNYIYREVSGTTPLGEELPPFFTHNRIMVQLPGNTTWDYLPNLDFSETEFVYAFNDGPGRYRFRVESAEVDPVSGNTLRTSWSNVRSIQFDRPQIDAVRVDYVDIIGNNDIEVRFSVDEARVGDAEEFEYGVYRATDAAGPFELAGVSSFDAVQHTGVFTDSGHDLSQGPYYYYIAATRSGCPDADIESDIVSSLFLEGEIQTYTDTQLVVGLAYDHFPGVTGIRLWRLLPGAIDWEDVGSVDSTPFSDDLSALLQNMSGEIRYRLRATYGTHTIESNQITIQIRIGLELFNAFNPGSSIAANRFFRPRLTGQLPAYYHLRIFNRWGQAIFEIVDPEADWEGWDGTDMNGAEAPGGVYGYRFEYQVGNNPREEIRGTVMLVR